MPQYSHNSPYYELHLSELEDDAVRVLAFEGIENISRLFKYSFQLLSENAELNAEDILNKKATFIMNRGDEDPLTICGIISRFEQRGQSPDYVSYYAELVPKMWRLGLTFQSRIFQNMDIEKMVTEVLETSEFSSDDFEFQLNETYPELEFSVQYRESDFDFINRRLEHFGIYYYFEHRDENDVIVFTDATDNLPEIDTGEDVLYNPNKDPLSEIETVSQFIYQGQVVTGKTQLKDYNYRDPSKDLLSESQISEDSPGTWSNYGDHYKDENEGQFLARVRNEEIVCNSVNYKGKSDCRLLRAGYKFTMGEHFREDWNLEYLLTKVITRGNQRGLFGILQPKGKVEPTYENYFEALPPDIIFRPNRLTQHPKIHGILNAKVDAAGDGEQAEIDDQGRYKVVLPFDLSGNADGEASHYIRMIQPYAGPNFGTHFPLHKGTEVLLTFIDGNPDRPIISGAIPNPETISPVTNANQTKSVIRDNYGNEIIMDATPGDEHIRLHSPHHRSNLTVGKSISCFTDSIKEDIWFGHKFEFGGGASEEIFFGNKFEAGIGSNINLGLATDFEAFMGTKASIGYGVEFDIKKMPKVELNERDIASEAKRDQIITAGDAICIAAGKKPKNLTNSLINADPKQLVLSYGMTQDPGASTNAWQYVIMGGSVILGIIAQLVYAAAGEAMRIPGSGLEVKDDDPAEKAIAMAVIGAEFNVILGLISGAIIAAYTLAFEKLFFKDDRIEPVYHKTPKEGEILRWMGLNKKGILLTINPKTKIEGKGTEHEIRTVDPGVDMDAKILLDDKGGIHLRSYAGEKKIVIAVGDKGKPNPAYFLSENGILIKSYDSNIKLKKDGKIELKAEGELNTICAKDSKIGAVGYLGLMSRDKDVVISASKGEVAIKSTSFQANGNLKVLK